MSDKLKFWSGNLLSKPVVILISGRAGVGKDTSADYLTSKLMKQYACLRTSFASNVKQIARRDFGWDDVKDSKGRKLLQNIGNLGREYDADIWVRKMINSYYDGIPEDFLIVSDWRFPNEKEWIEKSQAFQVVTIRIEARGREVLKDTPEYSDVSEISLPCGYLYTDSSNVASRYYDFVVDNTKTLDDLYKQLDWILNTLLGE